MLVGPNEDFVLKKVSNTSRRLSESPQVPKEPNIVPVNLPQGIAIFLLGGHT